MVETATFFFVTAVGSIYLEARSLFGPILIIDIHSLVLLLKLLCLPYGLNSNKLEPFAIDLQVDFISARVDHKDFISVDTSSLFHSNPTGNSSRDNC